MKIESLVFSHLKPVSIVPKGSYTIIGKIIKASTAAFLGIQKGLNTTFSTISRRPFTFVAAVICLGAALKWLALFSKKSHHLEEEPKLDTGPIDFSTPKDPIPSVLELFENNTDGRLELGKGIPTNRRKKIKENLKSNNFYSFSNSHIPYISFVYVSEPTRFKGYHPKAKEVCARIKEDKNPLNRFLCLVILYPKKDSGAGTTIEDLYKTEYKIKCFVMLLPVMISLNLESNAINNEDVLYKLDDESMKLCYELIKRISKWKNSTPSDQQKALL